MKFSPVYLANEIFEPIELTDNKVKTIYMSRSIWNKFFDSDKPNHVFDLNTNVMFHDGVCLVASLWGADIKVMLNINPNNIKVTDTLGHEFNYCIICSHYCKKPENVIGNGDGPIESDGDHKCPTKLCIVKEILEQ